MRNILAKILFCPPEYVGNVLIHMPIGWIIVALAAYSPLVGVSFAIYFLAYEYIEQLDLKDKAYQDLKGAMWGIAELGLPLTLLGLI